MDENEEINPLLMKYVEAITKGMVAAFDEIWTRPDAIETALGFIDGKISFVIRNDVVIIVRPEEDQAV